MPTLTSSGRFLFAVSIVLAFGGITVAQRSLSTSMSDDSSDFGPVVRAYLGYLSNEQEVVDDRISRREITVAYYRRNSNRIRALRQMAIRLARQSGNDYLPELEAVTLDELGTLFEKPPKPTAFRANEILTNKFRFLGEVHSGEVFYLFARLDPYEQADLMQRQDRPPTTSQDTGTANGQRVGQTATRPRRAIPQ